MLDRHSRDQGSFLPVACPMNDNTQSERRLTGGKKILSTMSGEQGQDSPLQHHLPDTSSRHGGAEVSFLERSELSFFDRSMVGMAEGEDNRVQLGRRESARRRYCSRRAGFNLQFFNRSSGKIVLEFQKDDPYTI